MFDRSRFPLQKPYMDMLQIWDTMDVILAETTGSGFVWIVDPVMHHLPKDNRYFSVVEETYHTDAPLKKKKKSANSTVENE